MDFFAGVLLTALAVFIYSKYKENQDKKSEGGSSGGGDSGPRQRPH